MWKEFKEFAFKGNVLDLAIAVVIGAAFGKIVSSLVDNIIMPIIAANTGKVDVSTLAVNIGDTPLTYGLFLQSIIDFLHHRLFDFLVRPPSHEVQTEKKSLQRKNRLRLMQKRNY